MKGSVNNTMPELKAFKRAPFLGLSQWENGNLTTNLAEKKDTEGAFFLVEAMLAPGTEPSPHVHPRGRTLLRPGRRVRRLRREGSFQDENGRMRVSPQTKAARICNPFASTASARSVYPRGVGRSLPRYEYARPTSGASHRGGHLFDR